MVRSSQAVVKKAPEPTPTSFEKQPQSFAAKQAALKASAAVYCGIFLTSASVLLLELALTRVFAVILWAHMAFLVVGSALFGFGLSGVFLALRKPRPAGSIRLHLSNLALTLVAATIGCYLVVTNVPFRMWSFSEDPMNFLYLAIWYVALIIPFFIAGLVIAQLLSGYAAQAAQLYGVDLIGAALGALLVLPVIPAFGAEGTVVAASLLAAGAALCFAERKYFARRGSIVLAIAVLALLMPKASEVFPIKLHQTKRRFNQAVNHDHVYETRWSSISRVDLAYHNHDLFDIWIDGGTNESAIMRWSGNMSTLQPQSWSSIGAVYNLKNGEDPKVAIIGSSGGREVLVALSHGAGHVDAIEMDPSIVELVKEEKYANFMGHLFQQPKVTLYNDEGRSFLRRQPESSYDVIQSINNYTPVAMSAGAVNLSAAFLLTKEAIHDYLDRLTPNGVLALHRGTALRLAIMMVAALDERGVENPRDHILISSGEVPYFDGIFLKKSPWTAEEVEKMGNYLHGRPLQAGKIFLWNPLAPEPNTIFGRVLLTPPAELEKFYTSLGVNLFPATDDRPFIEHFERFGRIDLPPELPREFRDRNEQKWRGIVPRGDFPYWAVLVESALLGFALLGLPLYYFTRRSERIQGFGSMLTYFSCLGFGFIVIEICLMKRYVLFLGNPAYSITTVLVVLLCAAGCGSLLVGRLKSLNPLRGIQAVIPLILLALLVEAFAAPLVFSKYLALSFPLRVLVASLFLAPLGVLLGMPFPLGLKLIGSVPATSDQSRSSTAWAWGMNGYFTVVGSASTVFLAVFFGFKAALMVACAAYAVGLFIISRGFGAIKAK